MKALKAGRTSLTIVSHGNCTYNDPKFDQFIKNAIYNSVITTFKFNGDPYHSL